MRSRQRGLRAVLLPPVVIALALASCPSAARGAAPGLVPLPPLRADAPWPAPDWQTVGPASAGLDPAAVAAALDGAFSDPASGRSRRTRAVVVVQGGRIVAERYAPGFTRDTPLLGWSATKSVTNALIGILARAGRLALDAPADVPAWRAPGDPRGAITVDHLLRMSSGLAWNEVYGFPGLLRSGVIAMLLGAGRHDMAAYAAARPLAHPPGTHWMYASGTSLVLSAVIRRAVGGAAADYHDFPRRALFAPIGMRSAVLEADEAGTFVGSSYLYATARDWARFGLLYLRGGVWNGTRILPAGWVDYTRTPAPAAPHGEYGAHFWLLAGVLERDGGAAPQGVPRDTFYAAGREGQYLAIVPSLDLVVVRLGLADARAVFSLPAFLADLAAARQARAAAP